MNKKNISLFILLLFISLPSLKLQAEFYKYTDKDGNLHFVDSKGKIPEEYREEDIKTYKEKYDHLPEKEKAAMLEKDHMEAEKKGEEIRQKLDDAESISTGKHDYSSLETKVIIKGNKVFVPVLLGYKGSEVQSTLIFDTGADGMLIHQDVADKLHIREFVDSEAKVAGGGTIKIKVAVLDYVKVGPHKKENLSAAIVAYQGNSPDYYQGLLGMAFLRGLKYHIDFEKRVIQWEGSEK